MAQFVEKAGGWRRALAAGAAGAIGVGGIAVAVGLTSCDASSQSVRAVAHSSRQAETQLALPNIPGSATKTEQTGSSPISAPSGIGSAPSANDVTGGIEPPMRVRILASAETLRIGGGGTPGTPGASDVMIGQGDPKGTTALSPTAKTDRRAGVSVSLKGGQWLVSEIGNPKGVATMYPATLSLVIAPAAAGQLLTVNGSPYPGTLRLSARPEGRGESFDVVDFVAIEEYLPGVVSKEMLPGWPLAAYQAQAVAARTYALQERDRSIGTRASFDVEANDHDQVYGGATTNATVREAVRSTRGLVLLDGERILRAYFCSTCGGRTAAAHDTWPTGPGYEFNLAEPIQEHHRESACSGSPLYRWSVDRPKWELVQRLKWFGERNGFPIKKIRDLKTIEIAQTNSDGRPNKYRIIEPSGTAYMLSAEELRLACNMNANGSVATIRPPSPEATPVPATLTGAPADPGAFASAFASPVMGYLGFSETAGTGSGAGVIAAPSAPSLMPGSAAVVIPDIDRRTRVHSSDFEVVVQKDRVTISGRGFGHGVGLCQYCAKAFAERGEDWRTMLERFYPGARLVTAY